MKRLPQSIEENFSAVVLYRDEVDEILKILKSVSESIEVSAEAYSFESDTEWIELKCERVSTFKIQSRNPEITVSISPQTVALSLGDNLPQGRGAFEQIKHVIRRSIRQPAFLYTDLGFLLVVLGGGFVCLYWSFFPGVVAAGGLWAWLNYVEKHRRGVVIPKYRREAPTFWARNSDKIILAVFSAFIGATITMLVNRSRTEGPKASLVSVVHSNSITVGLTNSPTNSKSRK